MKAQTSHGQRQNPIAVTLKGDLYFSYRHKRLAQRRQDKGFSTDGLINGGKNSLLARVGFGWPKLIATKASDPTCSICDERTLIAKMGFDSHEHH
jgi:hypothetical protein